MSDWSLVRAAGPWLRAERDRLGWSEEELVDRMDRLVEVGLRVPRLPSVEEIGALERGEGKYLPAWIKHARLAIERDHVAAAGAEQAWQQDRTWYRRDGMDRDPFDCSWPLALQYDFYMLEELDQMSDADRRLALACARAYVGPYAKQREDVLRRLIKLFQDLTGEDLTRREQAAAERAQAREQGRAKPRAEDAALATPTEEQQAWLTIWPRLSRNQQKLIFGTAWEMLGLGEGNPFPAPSPRKVVSLPDEL